MGFAEAELAQPAHNRLDLTVIGGDAIFLIDRRAGHKLYMGHETRLSPMERRRFFASLQHDIRTLSLGEFIEKHDLKG